MPIITQGAVREEEPREFVTPEYLGTHANGRDLAVACENHQDVSALQSFFARIALIRLSVPHFSDGRAFSQSQRLRHLGFRGTVRLAGHLIPDQWPHAVRCGVDEIDISHELLQRTTPQAWVDSTTWQGYQQRLQQRVSA